MLLEMRNALVEDSLIQLRKILEALLLASDRPLNLEQLSEIFDEDRRPARSVLREVLEQIRQSCDGRGFELVEVASGYRFQVRLEFAPWASRLWEDRPQRYSRALLETLAIIAYRQPITRGDIEDIRGVAVSTNIVKTLQEREWIRVVGHKDVPGRPAMYATTRQFLDYFNLTSLEQLPPLADIRDLEAIGRELEAKLAMPGPGAVGSGVDELGGEDAVPEDKTLH